MPDITTRFGNDTLVVDGAMGTMLHRAGIPSEQCHEQLNLTAPEVVLDVYRNYVLAGADCITTNTFGGSRPKLDAYGLGDQVVEFNQEAVRLARTAGAVHVLGDVGPTGLVMEPLGAVSFDEMFGHFREQVEALAAAGPDAILIETMTDIAEARCALLAARDACDLPVFVTLSYGADGRTELSGTTPEAAAVILEACGATAVGINCGLGPDEMLPIVEAIAAATHLPLVVQANAGMPQLVEGETVFPGTADEMGAFAARCVEAGAVLVGSCCGSTPSFTGAIADAVRVTLPATRRKRPGGLALASPKAAVRLGSGHPIAIIGERINPTGKAALAESLREGSLSVVREYAVLQEHDGADLLDVNVGAPGVDEPTMLRAAVSALSALSELPLVIDNTDPVAVEAALKVYPGRALVNSVNGGEESMSRLLPIARRYGAAVLILALDDEGIPCSTADRLEVAQRVRSAAHAAGFDDRDLAVDCLVLTAATDSEAAKTTLDAVRTVSEEWGIATVLGISNVSHGLPGRSALNGAFLSMAARAGLSAAIANPSDLSMLGSRAAATLLTGGDPDAKRWIAWASSDAARQDATAAPERVEGEPVRVETVEEPQDTSAALAAAVEVGDSDSAPTLVDQLVSDGVDPRDVISDVLSPAIQRLGDRFGTGEVFLPQLMVAAEAMKAAVARAKTYLPDSEGGAIGRVAFGTVKGDIHSIGKDICVSLLESAGYEVDDLGVDVAPERFTQAGTECDVVCLSALMTTTLAAMAETVSLLKQAGVGVVVGGAVVTASWAQDVGADYADDAPGCIAAVARAVSGT